MTGERDCPGLGLTAFYDTGSDNWDAGFDQNWLTLSATGQLAVLDRIDTVPGSPVDGQIFLMTGGINEDDIAVRDNGAWVYLTPKEGWITWVADEDREYVFNGTTWVSRFNTAAIDAAIAAHTHRVPWMYVREEQPPLTGGGLLPASTWTTRVLNTVVLNEITGASLSANKVTLPAGTYEVEAGAASQDGQGKRSKLIDVGSSTDLLFSTSEYGTGSFTNEYMTISGKIVLTSTRTLAIQSNGAVIIGGGLAGGADPAEIYSYVIFRKVA